MCHNVYCARVRSCPAQLKAIGGKTIEIFYISGRQKEEIGNKLKPFSDLFLLLATVVVIGAMFAASVATQ